MTDTTSKHPAFDRLMSQAYDRYQANQSQFPYDPEVGYSQEGRWSPKEFRNQLVGMEVLAIPLGNFTYQVQNGGFDQWHGNGYSTSRAEVKTALRMIGSLAAMTTLELLEKFERLASDLDVDLDNQNSYAHESDEDQWQTTENDLCKAFYEIDDQLLDDAEAFFAKAS